MGDEIGKQPEPVRASVATTSADLTDDEYTVLSIASRGESMMPLGRWKPAVESLVQKGLLTRHNEFNNYISDKGRVALEKKEHADDEKLKGALNKVFSAQQVQKQIIDFAEQAAALLVQAAKASSRVTGDYPAAAAQKWSEVILKRALELLGKK